MENEGALAEPAPRRDIARSSITPRGRAIGQAALIIMLGNLTGSLLGFARQFVMAKVFGDTAGTDAFVAASIVPQMFYDLTIGAAISAALIPTFSEIVERRGAAALVRPFGSVLLLAWLVLTAVVTVLLLAAQPFMSLILWGYHLHAHAGALPLAVEMVRILIPSLLFLGTSAVLLSTLYSLRRFTVPAFASALYHVGVIGGAIFLARPLGPVALAVGALAGAAAQAAVQVPALLRSGVSLRPRLELSPEVRHVIRLYAPVAAGLMISIVGQIIDLDFKSELATGSITAMQFATTLTQFPIGIAVAAMSFAVLPAISADAAFDRMTQFKDTLALGIRLVLFVTIPAAVGYMVLATPIASLLYQHGKFDPAGTTRTATALVGYAVQIPFVGVDQLLIFSFYARKNTVTPMLVGVFGVLLYIGSAWLLLPRWHIFGLALANTIQNSVHGLILVGLLFLGVGTLRGRGIMPALGKAVVAAAAMGAVAWVLAQGLAGAVNTHLLLGQAVEVLVPVTIGTTLYIGTALALGCAELDMLWQIMRREPLSLTS